MKHRSVVIILAVWISSFLVVCGVTVTPAQPTPAPATVVVTLRVATLGHSVTMKYLFAQMKLPITSWKKSLNSIRNILHIRE
jgi:hypothetical protein